MAAADDPGRPLARKIAARVASFVIGTSILLLLVAVLFAWLARREPEFYARATIRDPERLNALADSVMRRWSRAANAMQASSEPFSIELTSEEINAWLQRDLMERVRSLVPELREAPRVQLEGSRFRFGIATQLGSGRTVLSFDGSLWLASDGRLAIQVDHVHAGAAPLPTRLVIEQLVQNLREADYDIELRDHEGALVLLAKVTDENDRSFELLDVRIEDGKLLIAGRRSGRRRHAVQSTPSEPGRAKLVDRLNSHTSPSTLLK